MAPLVIYKHQSSLRHGRALQDTCIENLENVSEEGSSQVTSAEFLTFLSLQSNGTFDFDDFSDVPLDLRLLFYSTACSGGQDCTNGPPTIDLAANGGMALTLLQIFCSRVETILQSPTNQQLQVSFQYNLYYQADLSTEEILSRQNGNTIVDRLEVATKRVVLEALGCGVEDSDKATTTTTTTMVMKRVLHVQSPGIHDYINVMTTEEQEYCNRRNHDSSRLLQDADCAYTVTAVVDDLTPYGEFDMQVRDILCTFIEISNCSLHNGFLFLECDPPPPSDDIQCAIVASSVSIVPVDSRSLTEEDRALLRTVVVSAMLDSINNGSFKEHLP